MDFMAGPNAQLQAGQSGPKTQVNPQLLMQLIAKAKMQSGAMPPQAPPMVAPQMGQPRV